MPNNLQTNGRSSKLNSVRTFRLARAYATIESIFVIDHHFGERKAYEGSSFFLRRRHNGHDGSLSTDTG
jgi:hypothetical protein